MVGGDVHVHDVNRGRDYKQNALLENSAKFEFF